MRDLNTAAGLALIAAATLALSLPGSVEAQESGEEARTVIVEMLNYGYDPEPITVRRGDTVRFVNVTDVPHNAVFGEVPEGARLETRNIGPYLTKGETHEFVVDEQFVEGTYQVYCTPHEAMGMKGELIVEPPPEEPVPGGE